MAEQHRTAAREDRKEILLLAWGRRGRSTRKGLNEIKKTTPRSGYSTGPEKASKRLKKPARAAATKTGYRD